MLNLIKRAYAKLWERFLARQQPMQFDENAVIAVRESWRKKGLKIPEPSPNGCLHAYLVSNNLCGRRQLEGSNFCLWHHRSTEKYQTDVVTRYFGEPLTFREAIEREVKSGASLSDAYLEEAPLQGSFLARGVDLRNADLRWANLRKAHLSYGTLQSANLTGANLEFAFLSNVDLEDAVLTSSSLFQTKFRDNDFCRVAGLEKNCFRNWRLGLVPKYRILEEHPEQAEPIYRALMTYFATRGAIEDASWAAYRYRVMHHLVLRGKLRIVNCVAQDAARQFFQDKDVDFRRAVENGLITWMSSLIEYLISSVYRWTFGYGEKPLRVAVFSASVILVYAGAYDAFHVLKDEGFRNSLYFSIVTFTTLGYGDLTPDPNFRLFAASEALVGLLLSGLFLFTLARRSVGRA